MENANASIMRETTAGSFEGRLTFPQVVHALAAINIESYTVDLVSLSKTFYAQDGSFYIEDLPPFEGKPISVEFNVEQVRGAIRESQQQTITYIEFLQHIMAAGVSRYEVFIDGRKAIYTGRHGDFHVENFPSKI